MSASPLTFVDKQDNPFAFRQARNTIMGHVNTKRAAPPRRNQRLPYPLLPLGRDGFREAVLRRDRHTCVLCSKPADDAHHVLDRKLWSDGTMGCMLGNGASVCHDCHLRCETTTVSVEQVRLAAGITEFPLPPCLIPGRTYDKWGNAVRPDGTRERGPLRDEGIDRILARADIPITFVEVEPEEDTP